MSEPNQSSIETQLAIIQAAQNAHRNETNLKLASIETLISVKLQNVEDKQDDLQEEQTEQGKRITKLELAGANLIGRGQMFIVLVSIFGAGGATWIVEHWQAVIKFFTH